MNLNTMSREELIEELKKYMILCTKTIKVENTIFTKGEYYCFDNGEGGIFIKGDNGEWFDCYDDGLMKVFEKCFDWEVDRV